MITSKDGRNEPGGKWSQHGKFYVKRTIYRTEIFANVTFTSPVKVAEGMCRKRNINGSGVAGGRYVALVNGG